MMGPLLSQYLMRDRIPVYLEIGLLIRLNERMGQSENLFSDYSQ